MKYIVMHLSNYYPKQIIPKDYINKIYLYKFDDNNLEQKMYDNFIEKLDQMNNFIIDYNDYVIGINYLSNIKELIHHIYSKIKENINTPIQYHIRCNNISAYTYKLCIYSVELQ